MYQTTKLAPVINSNSVESDSTTRKSQIGSRNNGSMRTLMASSLVGDKVVNVAGERLGRIMDTVLNLKDGKIEYIVIKYGGFMGINEKHFVVPFHALAIDTDRRVFILDQGMLTM